jgi:hypothetical protein
MMTSFSNVQDNRTVLMYAVLSGDVSLVQSVLKKDASSVNAETTV